MTKGRGTPLRAAIQGEPGAFSHQAARQLLGHDVALVACVTFEALFAAVQEGRADRGIVPVENTLAGAVQRPMDLLLSTPVWAVAETRVPIRLCVAAAPGTALGDLRSAASHPVALQQCHRFFAAHPDIETRVSYDTAGSIKDLMEGRADYDAGIGSALAAELYGAVIVARDIQDHSENHTRFLAVARKDAVGPAPTIERPKTSVAFTVAHEPGALHAALGRLAEAGVDLTRLESRPIPGRPWEYRFYADIRGGSAEAQDRALERLEDGGAAVVLLGRYAEEEADPESTLPSPEVR